MEIALTASDYDIEFSGGRFAPPPDPWALVAVYPSVGLWHDAAAILKHRNIETHMAEPPDDKKGFALLVASSQVELAHQLLDPPVLSPVEAAAASPDRTGIKLPISGRSRSRVPEVRPVVQPQPSDRQPREYPNAVFILWALFVLLVAFIMVKLRSGNLG